jgi:hypothetical protein
MRPEFNGRTLVEYVGQSYLVVFTRCSHGFSHLHNMVVNWNIDVAVP